MDGLEEAHADADELPEEIDRRLAEIEAALAAIDERPTRFDAEDMARAGAFVSIDGSGSLRVERGYVRPEDEAPVEPSPSRSADQDNNQRTVAGARRHGRRYRNGRAGHSRRSRKKMKASSRYPTAC